MNIIVFDLDGTLAWTEKYWLPVLEEGLRKVENELGLFSSLPTTESALNHLGMPVDKLYQTIFPNTHDSDITSVRKIIDDCWSELLEHHPFQLYPETQSVLDWLKQNGFSIFLASNCDEAYMATMLRQTCLDEYVSKTACAGQYPNDSKSTFTVKLLHDVSYTNGFFVGDTESDMKAGTSAGLYTIYAEYGYGSIQSHPDYFLPNIKRLPKILTAHLNN